MKKIKMKLHTKIFIGMILGLIFGLTVSHLGHPEYAAKIKPIGQLFIKLIGMIVVPLIFASLVVGTASLNDIRKLSRIGGKTIGYYLITTTIALIIGLLLANILKPGMGLSEESKQQLLAKQEAEAGEKVDIAKETKPTITETLLNLVPKNPVMALAEGKMLQIIFFALLFGVALTLVPEGQAQPVIKFFEGVNDAIIQMVHLIIKLAPYGVFALISSIVASFGMDILKILFKYALVTLLGMLIHTVVTYPLAVKLFTKLKIRNFFKGIRQAQLIALSCSSSSATLPVTMECCEKNLGVSKDVCSFALPLGSTINMDGTALYQAVSAVFIAQVYAMDLTWADQLTIILTATLASIGAAGAPMVGILMLVVVLESIGIDPVGIAMIWGLEPVLDMCRTVVNITGDASCTVVVASSEKEIAEVPPMKLLKES